MFVCSRSAASAGSASSTRKHIQQVRLLIVVRLASHSRGLFCASVFCFSPLAFSFLCSIRPPVQLLCLGLRAQAIDELKSNISAKRAERLKDMRVVGKNEQPTQLGRVADTSQTRYIPMFCALSRCVRTT